MADTSIRGVTFGGPAPVDSVWDSQSVTPGVSVREDGGVNLGVRFIPAVNGRIKAVRFWLGSASGAPDGVFSGHVYDVETGDRLGATPDYTPVASGYASGNYWLEFAFSTPVEVVAGRLYTAAVFTGMGLYSASLNFFTASVEAGPLRLPNSGILYNGQTYPNGVFRYQSTPGNPYDSFNSANYWVDPVFEEAAVAGLSVSFSAGAASGEVITVQHGTAAGATLDLGLALDPGAASGVAHASAPGYVDTLGALFTPGAAAGQCNASAPGASLSLGILLDPGEAHAEVNGTAPGASWSLALHLLATPGASPDTAHRMFMTF